MAQERLSPEQAARLLVKRDFADCLAAFLAGSVVRGEATPASDLDILIIVPSDQPNYRESLKAFDWPVEFFVQSLETHYQFREGEIARRRPSTAMIVCEGLVLQDRQGLATRLKEEACALLAEGPPPLSKLEVDQARYALTDALDDFLSAQDEAETVFVANWLAVAATDLMLDHHRQWRGNGKWLPRALRRLDPALVDQLLAALQALYREGDREPLVAYVDQSLDLVGGRLWEGFRLSSS